MMEWRMSGDGDWGNTVLSDIGHGQDVMDGHFMAA
jgi:hypothetical protein